MSEPSKSRAILNVQWPTQESTNEKRAIERNDQQSRLQTSSRPEACKDPATTATQAMVWVMRTGTGLHVAGPNCQDDLRHGSRVRHIQEPQAQMTRTCQHQVVRACGACVVQRQGLSVATLTAFCQAASVCGNRAFRHRPSVYSLTQADEVNPCPQLPGCSIGQGVQRTERSVVV